MSPSLPKSSVSFQKSVTFVKKDFKFGNSPEKNTESAPVTAKMKSEIEKEKTVDNFLLMINPNMEPPIKNDFTGKYIARRVIGNHELLAEGEKIHKARQENERILAQRRQSKSFTGNPSPSKKLRSRKSDASQTTYRTSNMNFGAKQKKKATAYHLNEITDQEFSKLCQQVTGKIFEN